MAIVTRISEQEYRELSLSAPDHRWELWAGVAVEKPLMSMQHEEVSSYLGHLLQSQLDRRAFRVHVNGARTRLSSRNYYIPDVVAIPAALVEPFKHDPHSFNAFAEPLPLVVEVWSRSTGIYDFEAKLQGYRARGDLEFWYIHPYDRTLTAGRKQPDGSYSEETYRGGIVSIASLPGVTIDLDTLLDG